MLMRCLSDIDMLDDEARGRLLRRLYIPGNLAESRVRHTPRATTDAQFRMIRDDLQSKELSYR